MQSHNMMEISQRICLDYYCSLIICVIRAWVQSCCNLYMHVVLFPLLATLLFTQNIINNNSNYYYIVTIVIKPLNSFVYLMPD